METGIASTLIRKTVELGGDKPMVTIALLNIVTAIIFTAMTGAGPVIAIGIIVLPIMMSLGVPKAIAMFSFMESVAAGIYLNPLSTSLSIVRPSSSTSMRCPTSPWAGTLASGAMPL